ncbi:methyltransferase family protein [Klebsiella pneumoniae]
MNKLPKIFYYLLISACIISISVLILLKNYTLTVTFIIYTLWVLGEKFISIRDEKKSNGEKDQGTVVIYASARLLNLLSCMISVVLLGITSSVLQIIIGSVLIITGAIIRYIAIKRLGKFYSHLIDIKKDHYIITDGIYAYLRHPAYTGMLISTIGLTTTCFSWLSASTLFFGLIPAIYFRMKIEERNLALVPGYAEYQNKTKKIIPFLY